MMRLGIALGIAVLIFSGSARAVESLGDPNAVKGGEFTVGFPTYPKSLLYYLATDSVSAAVNSVILETMIEVNPETYEHQPLLAEKWTISNDKKTFTFFLNPSAKFSDGKPVTAEDVKFTWDTLLDEKNKTAPFRAHYASFQSCEVVDPHTVRFIARDVHFKNLEKIGGLFILPKSFYSKGNFNKDFNREIQGSGPYLLDKLDHGKSIYLKRNPNYWGKDLPQNVGRFNFDQIHYKAVPDYNVQYEMFKRGDIDYFYFLVSKMWATETDGPLFQDGSIKKLKGENRQPYATQGIAWNLRKPIFQDLSVRLALSHLMNRDKYIKELFYNNYVPSSGVVAVSSEYHSPNNQPVPYDPQKAKDLLAEAGWSELGPGGTLKYTGKRKGVRSQFEFDLITNNPASHRYLTIYQEDLKKMGIKMNIRTLDWSTSLKLMDDRNFDSAEIARGRSIDPGDFGVMWGSDQADIKGSSNITGYKNPEVDKLAREIDSTFDRKARIPLVRKLDEILSKDQPMTFAWEATFFRVAYWNKFSFPGKGYFNYSEWSDIFHYWWLDGEKTKKIKSVAQGSSEGGRSSRSWILFSVFLLVLGGLVVAIKGKKSRT